MVSARKVIVSIVMLVLSVYFIAGVFGAIPYQYDYIKQNANTNNPMGAEQTNTADTLTIYHSPILKATIGKPIKISMKITDSGSDVVSAICMFWDLSGGHVGGEVICLTLTSGTVRDGTWSGEIPAITAIENMTYCVRALDAAGHIASLGETVTNTYVIQITNENYGTIFGIDYRVFHAIGLGLTLIIGYVAYGSGEKVGKWRREED